MSGTDYFLNVCLNIIIIMERIIPLFSHEACKGMLGLKVSVILISFYSFIHLFIRSFNMYLLTTN